VAGRGRRSRRLGERDRLAAQELAEEVQRRAALLPARPPDRHQHCPSILLERSQDAKETLPRQSTA
jgi:hypothetical protein